MLKINTAYITRVLLLDDNDSPVTGATVNYTLIDESHNAETSGTMTEDATNTGIYYVSWTPNAAGTWTLRITSSSPARGISLEYQVGEGVEQDTYDIVNHATYGLSALNTNLAADFDRHVTWIDCWSDETARVQITGVSSDVNLPDVIVPTLPTGATIWKVVILFKSHTLKDTSTLDNAINTASAIRIKKSTGIWGVDDIVAYDIPDNAWAVDVSEATEKTGPCFVGNINNDDLSSEVDAAATYNLRFENIQADGANLELEGVAVGLRVYFY